MKVGVSLRSSQGLILLALAVLLNGSCRRGSGELPVLPPSTDPLSRLYIGYGVVSVSYIQVLDEPGGGGHTLGHLRRGSLVQVLERRVLTRRGKGESWVLVDGAFQGWLPEQEDILRVYDNEARARTAAESLAR